MAVPTGGARLAKWLANPALRSKLPTGDLTTAQQAARAWAVKTQTPVTPGSSLTQAQLASQTKAAIAEKYGPAQSQDQANLKSAQQFQQNQASWYQQYLAAAQANQTAVANSTTQANNEINALQGATANLAGQSPGADQTSVNAAAVRSALLGSFGALVAGQGNAANANAINRAQVVAPGQAIVGSQAAEGIVQKALSDLSTLAQQKGADATSFKASTIANEEKNVLAQQTLNTTQTNDTAKNTVATTNATTSATKATNTAQQQAHALAEKTHAGTNVTNGAWASWGQQGATGKAKQQAAVASFAKQHAKTPKTPKVVKPTSGPGSLTQVQENDIVTKVQNAEETIKMLQAIPGTSEARVRAAATTKFDAWAVNAAMDLAYNGYLSEPNIRALHARGAKVLGHFPTKPPARPKPTGPDGRGTG